MVLGITGLSNVRITSSPTPASRLDVKHQKTRNVFCCANKKNKTKKKQGRSFPKLGAKEAITSPLNILPGGGDKTSYHCIAKGTAFFSGYNCA